MSKATKDCIGGFSIGSMLDAPDASKSAAQDSREAPGAFPFDKFGKGMFGPDGVEAVMPLKRNEDGSLSFLNKEEIMSTNDRDQLAKEVADLCARHFYLAGHHFSRPFWPTDIAALGDSTKAGMLLAAAEMRGILSQFDEGRKALRDLGFEPVFQNVECK